LATAEDRLFFLLVYLKTNCLQVIHGELFGMGQQKANQWIHTLLPVLLAALRDLGDAPARTMEQLAQRLGIKVSSEDLVALVNATDFAEAPTTPSAAVAPPLFAMMEPSGVFSVPKMLMNRKRITVGRKNVTP
jgi:Helix-turn-helix of DDE superfamily endonuclease